MTAPLRHPVWLDPDAQREAEERAIRRLSSDDDLSVDELDRIASVLEVSPQPYCRDLARNLRRNMGADAAAEMNRDARWLRLIANIDRLSTWLGRRCGAGRALAAGARLRADREDDVTLPPVDEVKALLEKSTKGPWEVRHEGTRAPEVVSDAVGEVICSIEPWSPQVDEADAALIALAPALADAYVAAAQMREALTTLTQYARWQMTDGHSHHPTLGSAVAAADAALAVFDATQGRKG